MKHIYFLLCLSAIITFTSCTPEMQGELEQILTEAKLTFYISPSGNDSNSGNSPEEAWRSIAKLNEMEIVPGSKILFEGGQSFTGNLSFTEEDGNDGGNPILISSYGTGRATIVAGNGYGINVYNTAGITIDNLIITGSGMNVNQSSGIKFFNDLPGDIKLQKVRITNSEISGFKHNGILIDAENNNSGFNDVLIENVKVHSCLDAGIQSTGHFGYQKVGYAHSNIIVRKSEVYNIPGYTKGGNSGSGIVLSDVQYSLIEYSTVYDSGHGNTHCGGPVGIWYWDADTVTIQHSEVYNMSSGSGCDGGGFDLDGGVTNGIMQYNYSHDNDGGGFLVGQFSWARPMNNIIVRYNISENDAATNGGSVYLFKGEYTKMDNIYVYNNTFYISKPGAAAIKYSNWKPVTGNMQFTNNILYATNGAALVSVPTGYSATLKGNLYYSSESFAINYKGTSYKSLESFRSTGNELLNGSPVGFEGDPQLNSPGTGVVIGFGQDLTSLDSYKLIPDSPAVNKGINLSGGIGERDYYGSNPLKDQNQDIGAHEL